jgi:hypothetical protein
MAVVLPSMMPAYQLACGEYASRDTHTFTPDPFLCHNMAMLPKVDLCGLSILDNPRNKSKFVGSARNIEL